MRLFKLEALSSNPSPTKGRKEGGREGRRKKGKKRRNFLQKA
jgi:hypothetical protein